MPISILDIRHAKRTQYRLNDAYRKPPRKRDAYVLMSRDRSCLRAIFRGERGMSGKYTHENIERTKQGAAASLEIGPSPQDSRTA